MLRSVIGVASNSASVQSSSDVDDNSVIRRDGRRRVLSSQFSF
jgi:hypothetical protein